MAADRSAGHFVEWEIIRERLFKLVWPHDLESVLSEVAGLYDRANKVASPGLRNFLRDSFISMMELSDGQKVLDVCAGSTAVLYCHDKRLPMALSAARAERGRPLRGSAYALQRRSR